MDRVGVTRSRGPAHRLMLKKAKKAAAKELWLELGRKLGYCT